MKKLLTLMLAIVLCASCFAGCNDKKTASDGDVTVIEVTTTEAGAQAAYEKLVEEYNATEGKEKGIEIKWTTTTDSNAIDVSQMNGKLPHIFMGNGNQREKFVKNGDVMAINDLPGGEEFLADFNQEGTEGDNLIDGKTYFIYPTVRNAGLAYNKELFKKAGLVDEKGEALPPKTLSEVVEYAKKLTDTKNQIYGFAFPLKFGISYTVSSPLASYYDGFTPETSQTYTDLDTLTVTAPNHKEQYQWLFDMKKAGSLFPGAETLDNDTARAYFSQGKVGMIPAVSWDVGVYTSQFIPNFEWGICQYPAPDGRELYKHWNQRGASMMISNKAKEAPEETMEVFKFIYSLETRTAIFEEGVNLSMKTDVLEVYDKDKVSPQFAQFAEFVDETNRYAKNESYTYEGDSWATLFQKAWGGNLTLDQAIAQYEKNATDSLRRGVKKGEYDVERQKRVKRYLKGEDGLDLSLTH